MSDVQAKRLADDIKPALVKMVGDEALVLPELSEGIVATSISYRAGPNLILYSPIYSVVLVLHYDRYKRLYVYALGFEELEGFVRRPIPSKTNYFELRYTVIPKLINDLRARLTDQSDATISSLHGALSWGRKVTANQVGLLKPVVRQADSASVRCIKTLDKAAIVASIQNELKDKNDENWFDHMTLGDVLTDVDGSMVMIFINDATRRLHLIVPVTQKNDRCVPGEIRTTFIQ